MHLRFQTNKRCKDYERVLKVRMKVRTILGDIDDNEIGITLPHEHICCYSEYLHQMAGNLYLDKETLDRNSIEYLKELKEKYSLRTFVDCTPVNIGRDVDLLKRVSKESGVNIICSTGFYYTEETLLHNMHINCIVLIIFCHDYQKRLQKK